VFYRKPRNLNSVLATDLVKNELLSTALFVSLSHKWKIMAIKFDWGFKDMHDSIKNNLNNAKS